MLEDTTSNGCVEDVLCKIGRLVVGNVANISMKVSQVMLMDER